MPDRDLSLLGGEAPSLRWGNSSDAVERIRGAPQASSARNRDRPRPGSGSLPIMLDMRVIFWFVGARVVRVSGSGGGAWDVAVAVFAAYS